MKISEYRRLKERLQSEFNTAKSEFDRKMEALNTVWEMTIEDGVDIDEAAIESPKTIPIHTKMLYTNSTKAIRELVWAHWKEGVTFRWTDVRDGLAEIFTDPSANQTTIAQKLRYMARDGDIQLVLQGGAKKASVFRNVCSNGQKELYLEGESQ